MRRQLLGAALAALVSTTPALASIHHHHRHHAHHRPSWRRAEPVTRAALIPLPRPRPDAGLPALAYAPADDDAIGEGLGLAELPAAIIGTLARKAALAADRLYLVLTACPGYTMHRQGVATAISRLNPTFVRRLAAAFRDARAHGIRPCIYSAYRPPGYGVGGWRDKYQSAHAYGLAVDLSGIGHPGSTVTLRWRIIAAAHGVAHPYPAGSRAEFNHAQPCMVKAVARAVPPLRRTIASLAPISLALMWELGDKVIATGNERFSHPAERVRHLGHRRARFAVHPSSRGASDRAISNRPRRLVMVVRNRGVAP